VIGKMDFLESLLNLLVEAFPQIVAGIFLLVVAGIIVPIHNHYLSTKSKKILDLIDLKKSLGDSAKSRLLDPLITSELERYVYKNRPKVSDKPLLIFSSIISELLSTIFCFLFLNSALVYQFKVDEFFREKNFISEGQSFVFFDNLYNSQKELFIACCLIASLFFYSVCKLTRKFINLRKNSYGAVFLGGKYETHNEAIIRIEINSDKFDLTEKICSDFIFVHESASHEIHVYIRDSYQETTNKSLYSGFIPIAIYNFVKIVNRDKIETFENNIANPVLAAEDLKYTIIGNPKISKAELNEVSDKILFRLIPLLLTVENLFPMIGARDFIEIKEKDGGRKNMYLHKYGKLSWWDIKKSGMDVFGLCKLDDIISEHIPNAKLTAAQIVERAHSDIEIID